MRSCKAAEVVDDVDWVTKTDLINELELTLESSDAGLWMRDVNVIASPAQGIRDILDLMPTETEGNWSDINGRLHNLPKAVDGYIETLRLGIEKGIVPAKRQVREVIEQAKKHGAGDGFFHNFTGSASLAEQQPVPESLKKDLADGAVVSAGAYEKLADFLTDELLPAAQEDDGVGREIYALQSRRFLGAKIDLDETYEWGIEELARMTEEQEAIAKEIKPGASVLEAIEVLDADPARKLEGTKALQEWMQQLSDKAVAELSATHFDIPDPIKRLECMIAPTQEGGIYYTSPSDDFSRPGRMWWSVPEGVTDVQHLARDHDGVPRGRSGPPPAARPGRLQPREAQHLPPPAGRHVGPRRGLGALRGAPHGAARLPRRPGRPPRHARRPADARRPRRARHRRAPQQAQAAMAQGSGTGTTPSTSWART